jgi:hypothetical protein
MVMSGQEWKSPRAPDGFVVWLCSGSLWLETCRSPESSDGPAHVRVHTAAHEAARRIGLLMEGERKGDWRLEIGDWCSGTRC